MKKTLFFIFRILIILLSISLILGKYYNKTNANVDVTDNISIMHTDEDYIATYSIYNTYNKSLKKSFSRENKHYSDYIIDKKNNAIYFSDLINNRYDIYKVDLSDKDKKTTSLLDSEYSGDIFDINNDKIIFRTPTDDRTSYTLGVHSLTNNNTKKWINQDSDVYIYNFYWDKDRHIVYTIERSLSEMENTELPQITTHKIFKYDENGKNKQLLYSTDESISNISVNNQGNKIIYDESTLEKNTLIYKIYLLDLNNNKKQVIIKSNDKFENSNFSSLKYPKFSSNRNGLYFLASTSKSKIIQEVKGSTPLMSRAIYYYDFNSKKINIIYEDNKNIINIFKLN